MNPDDVSAKKGTAKKRFGFFPKLVQVFVVGRALDDLL